MVLDLGFYVRITQKVKLYGVSILPDKIDDGKDFLTKTLEGKDLMCQIAFSKKVSKEEVSAHYSQKKKVLTIMLT
tara:strand:+ start:378 stop:602 length:225 start_codon:yes stop_codon:yes gene_type:complete